MTYWAKSTKRKRRIQWYDHFKRTHTEKVHNLYIYSNWFDLTILRQQELTIEPFTILLKLCSIRGCTWMSETVSILFSGIKDHGLVLFFCGTPWSVSTSPPMNSNNEYYKLRQVTKDTIDGKAAMIMLTTRFVWITMEPCSTDDSMMSDFRSSIVSYCASWQMKHMDFVDGCMVYHTRDL